MRNESKPYLDGYEVGLRRGDIEKIERAIKDCKEMGWRYLEKYFEGQLAGAKERVGMDSEC